MKSWRWDAMLLKNSDRVNQRRPETRLLTSSWVVNFWVCESGLQSCPHAWNAAFSLLSETESVLLTLERKSFVVMNPVRHEDRKGVLRRVSDTVSTKDVKYQYCIQHKY